ncbi:MAG: iron ABC transporter permease [Betaproteobacteria bacterium]|nr:iron ABC transporter permease [Betaproteobacteria bacterium]MBI2961921.1 iron ABC transporter permease [Betaproteobacteria bacterium]
MSAAESSAFIRPRRPIGRLGVVSIATAALLLVPMAMVLANVFATGEGAWAHLAASVLPDYLRSTAILVLGVMAGVLVLGVPAAWLVTAYRFPGQRLFEWALVLPLAMPAYVIAYAYTDALQFSGPLQTWIRGLTGWRAREYFFPEIRSLGGAIAMFSLVFYPYVYMLARAAFLQQSRNLLEAGKLLGRGAWGTFFRVALPLARPAIAAGASLALMETLADYGAVSYFAVQTFTTGIFRAWLSMGDSVAAAQLSALLMLFVAAILLFEQWNRGAARFYGMSAHGQGRPHFLSGGAGAAAAFVCAVPLLLGFFAPLGILLRIVITDPDSQFTARFFDLTLNTLTLAGITALIAASLAVLMSYAARLSASPAVAFANRAVSLGYAIPGAVIAVGVLLPLGRIDNLIADWARAQFGVNPGLLFTGSIAALVYAYLVRFLAVALQTVEAGLGKIKPSMEDAARSLGCSPARTLVRVHAPIMRGSVLTAALIVFVDVMKELPATFAMRPFNFDTLAVQAYNMAKDERLAEAAAASLVIIAAGLIPLYVLSYAITRGRVASA